MRFDTAPDWKSESSSNAFVIQFYQCPLAILAGEKISRSFCSLFKIRRSSRSLFNDLFNLSPWSDDDNSDETGIILVWKIPKFSQLRANDQSEAYTVGDNHGILHPEWDIEPPTDFRAIFKINKISHIPFVKISLSLLNADSLRPKIVIFDLTNPTDGSAHEVHSGLTPLDSATPSRGLITNDAIQIRSNLLQAQLAPSALPCLPADVTIHYVGLPNQCAICHMNAMLQSFAK
jgi:hypothetical protein